MRRQICDDVYDMFAAPQNVSNAKLIFSTQPEGILSTLSPEQHEQAFQSSFRESVPWPQTPDTRVVFPAWRLLQRSLMPILHEVWPSSQMRYFVLDVRICAFIATIET